MTPIDAKIPRWKVYLRLGRVSNLPTVWTNVIAGVVLARGQLSFFVIGLLALSLSLFYIGGMFLNDTFDRGFDAGARPERPIPAGLISAEHVFAVGLGLLIAGEILIIACGACTGAVLRPAMTGGGLAVAIVVYDLWHKQNPLSPIIMGLCRALVYCTAASIAGPESSSSVIVGALVGWAYLIGLTYAAKQESLNRISSLWPLGFLAVPFVYGLSVLKGGLFPALVYTCFLVVVILAIRLLRGHSPGRFQRAVMLLIAGISLLDALLVAGAGSTAAVLVTATGFPATLWMQRWVRGT